MPSTPVPPPPRAHAGLPALASRLLLVLAGLMGGLLAAELMTRLLSLDPLAGQQGLLEHEKSREGCLRPAGHYGYELAPGTCGTNRYGLVGPEYPLEKAEGTRRIVALGDSITEQRAWVEILGAMLEARRDAPVELWNLGVTGFAVPNELEMLRHRGLDLEPDMVLLQICLNDYGVTPVLFAQEGRLFWLRADTGLMGDRSLWLFEHSALFRMFVMWRAGDQATLAESEERDATVDAALIELVRLCRERDIPVMVMLFPTLAPMERWPANEATAYRRFLELMQAHDLPHIDLTATMMAGGIEDLRRYHGREVFDDLDARLLARGLPPEAGTLLRGLDTRMLGVTAPVSAQQAGDYTHPNFLGHYLAAQAVLPWVEAELP